MAITTLLIGRNLFVCETLTELGVLKDQLDEMKEGDIITVRYLVDENMLPTSDKTYLLVNDTEENFHTRLRKESSQQNQFITSHSTDSDWNPEGYIRNLDDVLR